MYNDKRAKGLRRTLRKNQTEAEKILWRHIRNKQVEGHKFFRQYSVGKYILDFYCPKKRIAIEIDGGQHAEKKNLAYDRNRTSFLENNHIKVLRFWNTDVMINIGGVMFKIREKLGLEN